MEDLIALASLAAIAFGAATILPLQSEILFIGLIVGGDTSLPLLLLVASVFNTLGSCVNYWLGWYLDRFEGKKWFPASPRQMERARNWYNKWGVWALLLSWAPLGDAMTVIAGVMRTNFWLFTLLVGISKTSRYIVVMWLTVATGYA
ncbi:MAG: YqaA family protein [Pseudomonadota bacterium]|nr:YqaA family protein [Pseudomonadota bacterium]MEE3071556.1 YqaA family protein [Pseudomonadota bacterium]